MDQSSEGAEGFCSDNILNQSAPSSLLSQGYPIATLQEFHVLLNTLPSVVWLANSLGEIIHVNEAWVAMTGRTASESVGWQFFKPIHADDRDRVLTKWRQALQAGHPFDVKTDLQQQSGAYQRVWLRARQLPTPTESGIAWIGSLVNLESDAVSVQQAQEQELQAIITRNMAEGICLVRLRDGVIVYANPKFERMFGYGPGELNGQPVVRVNYHDAQTDPVAVSQQIAQAVMEQGEATYDVHNVKKDGTPFWCRATTSIFEHPEHGTTLVAVQQDITQQKETEQHLRYSERRFQGIFDQTFQFMGLLAPDGTLLEANRTALDFGGIEAQDVIGLPFWETYWWTISPETQTQLREAIARAAQGEFIRYEVDVLGKEHTIITIDFSLKPIHDDTGNIILLIPEGRDVTQRKQAEAKIHQLNVELEERVMQRTAQLATSNQRYEALTRISPVGIFRATHDDEGVYANERWCAIAGLQPNEIQRYQWVKAIHPGDRERVLTAWNEAVTANELFRAEYRFRHPNGDEIWVYGQATPETNAAGEPVGYVGTVTDITELKLAEQALKDSEELFRATFEQAAVGFAQLTLDGHWLRVNQKLCDIVGYSRAELMAQTFQSITHPEDLHHDLAYVNKLLAGEISGYSLEKRYIRKDGSIVWASITISLIYESETGLPKYFVGVIEDISARRRIQAERQLAEQALQERAIELIQLNALLARTATKLEERNRELDQFAYIASHDLKAPLRAIANLSEWLEDDLQSQLPPENQRQMQLLRERVYRMESLINGLLQYSRIGRTDNSAERVVIQDLLMEVIDSLAPPPTIAIAIAPEMPTLTTRKLLLRQVFANLISNAIKHRDRPEGRVQIEAQDQGLMYEFSVADDGPGIDPAHHERIFLIFQTLESHDQKENTGVGLSIVKKIVETEGGSIQVESQRGQGTTFRFTWPKQAPRSPEP